MATIERDQGVIVASEKSSNGTTQEPFFEVEERGLDTVKVVTVSTSTAASVAKSLGITVTSPKKAGSSSSK